jgi:hypothetical protein
MENPGPFRRLRRCVAFFRRAFAVFIFPLLSLVAARATDLTTTNCEPGGSDWNTAIWRPNGIGSAQSPFAGNTYQTVFNGTNIGNGNLNTRVRTPTNSGTVTFPGNSLTLNVNTELRAKKSATTLNFPGVSGNPGLILNGGMLNDGDDSTTVNISGRISVAAQSYISNGKNGGGGGLSISRAFNFTGALSGSGDLVILLCDTSQPQQVSSVSNSFSGEWIVQCGWLLGSGAGSLGTNNIIVDPLYSGYLTDMPSFQATSASAWFEAGYDLNSPGTLILTNGGMMILHQNCAFASVIIEGNSLSAGTHDYSELTNDFPNNFAAGGVGSITVQPYGTLPSFAPAVSRGTTPPANASFNGGTVRFSAAFIGQPPIAYQWRFSTDGVNYADVPGATNTTLTLTNVQAANAGYYSCWASNAVNGDFTVSSGNGQLSLLGPAPALKPIPLSANQRGTITCLENPSFTYDIYLPPAYSTNGTPLPILYTMYASGGGMVTDFTNACAAMNIIVVGITRSKNGQSWDTVLQEQHAVTLDVRHRVLYDPTAEFAGGESGGGECAYMLARARAQHIAGLIEMAGNEGRGNVGASVTYYGTDRFQTNLFVAFTTGTNTTSPDTAAIFYNPFVSNYLAYCGDTVQNYYFDGGHSSAPQSLNIPCLSWLLSERTPAGLTDASNAWVTATNWQARIAAGDQGSVLRECVSNLMNYPRTWNAYYGEQTLDGLLTNYTVFRTLDVSNLAQGDFASDMFYYYARGAALNSDWNRYKSCMKALTGITITNDFIGTTTISNIVETVVFPTDNAQIFIITTNNDRAGDIYGLVTNYYHYPSPQLQSSAAPGQFNVWLIKDTLGLAYTLQFNPDLQSSWQSTSATTVDTNTIWSATDNPSPDATAGFYRVLAAPSPAWSPPWPL